MKPDWVQRVDNAIETILTIPKLLLLSRITLGKPKPLKPTKEAIILGNGPSLKAFLKQHLSFLEGKAVFCVNNFVRTPAFRQVRPSYYVLAATDFWQKEEKPGWQEERARIFQELSDQTEWPMMLLVPVMAKTTDEWRQPLLKNSNIQIGCFNNTPVEGFPSFLRFCLNKGLGMPRPHNVLVASLSIVLMMRFQTIYITGADHSWMKEVFVTDDNRVFLSQKHFYDGQLKSDTYTDKARPMYAGSTTNERKLHEILEKWYYSFRSYWELNGYAQSIGSRIINVTPDSYIDAFERQNISELVTNE
ncbi:MAG: hypothetical protein AAF992_27260 [Bacteroidota bacterium]